MIGIIIVVVFLAVLFFLLREPPEPNTEIRIGQIWGNEKINPFDTQNYTEVLDVKIGSDKRRYILSQSWQGTIDGPTDYGKNTMPKTIPFSESVRDFLFYNPNLLRDKR